MKHYASVVGNRGQKHAYACSLLFRSSNDLRSRQDSGFPQDFFILFLFFIFMFLIHGKTPDMIAARACFGPVKVFYK
jgi:hypothetical protein